MDKETKAQKKKRLNKRNEFRNTVCKGCRHNYYNYPKPHDGINVGVEEDYSCWSIDRVKRGKCLQHS